MKWAAANREKKREYDRRYHERHKEKRNAQSRAYHEANGPTPRTAEQEARYRANRRKAVAASPEKRADRNARTAAWKKANLERARELGREAQRRRRLGRDREAIAFAEVLRRDPCSYCGEAGGTIDHIDAVVNGGTNSWANLTSACLSCNSRKQDRSLLMFITEERKFHDCQ